MDDMNAMLNINPRDFRVSQIDLLQCWEYLRDYHGIKNLGGGIKLSPNTELINRANTTGGHNTHLEDETT